MRWLGGALVANSQVSMTEVDALDFRPGLGVGDYAYRHCAPGTALLRSARCLEQVVVGKDDCTEKRHLRSALCCAHLIILSTAHFLCNRAAITAPSMSEPDSSPPPEPSASEDDGGRSRLAVGRGGHSSETLWCKV